MSVKIPNAVTLKVLVETYYSNFPKSGATSCSLDNAVGFLLAEGLITSEVDSAAYTTTEKGGFFIDHLLTIPVPEVKSVWVIPS